MVFIRGDFGVLCPDDTHGEHKLIDCPYIYKIAPKHIFDKPYNLGVRPSFSFPLYKMTKREHAESFFRDGTLRLGTFSDYASEDLHGTSIGDYREGLLITPIILKNMKVCYSI